MSLASPLVTGISYGYFVAGDQITFVCDDAHRVGYDATRDALFLAGDFNGWQAAVGQEEWRMRALEIEGERVLGWTGAAAKFLEPAGQRFKFVTGEHQWLSLPDAAPNALRSVTHPKTERPEVGPNEIRNCTS